MEVFALLLVFGMANEINNAYDQIAELEEDYVLVAAAYSSNAAVSKLEREKLQDQIEIQQLMIDNLVAQAAGRD